jgi:hypothetical protein
MPDAFGLVLAAVVMGVVGSAAMDAWSAVLRRRFAIATLDYRILGRWIGHMAHGQFRHARIAGALPVHRERLIGWSAHYAIGITFAVVLVVLAGPAWLASPTIGPALAVGLLTIVAPWLVMQPAMGAGVAGSLTPNPAATRLRNVGTHTAYGLGLSLGAVMISAVL